MPAVFDSRIEEFAREVLGIRPIPCGWIVRPGNIYAASGANCICQGATLSDVLKVLTALDRIGIKKILPGAHFSDNDILSGESAVDLIQQLRIGKRRHLRAISCAIAKAPMLPS